MIGLYAPIKDDLFGIARALKAMDRDYFVVYSYRDNRYEVHNRGNKGNTFCFWAEKLDNRVLVKACRTRRERIKALLKEIECENGRLLSDEKYRSIKKIQSDTEKALSRG